MPVRDTDYWFEDFRPGDRWVTEGATLTEAQILEFSARWDPQPFHMDLEAAKASEYGGLIASGFQTLMTAFRLWHAMRVANPSSQGSPGFEELRWKRPTRPGDTIHAEVEVVSARPSGSRPHLGIVEWRTEVYDQTGAELMRWRAVVMHLKRPENRAAAEETP